MLNSNNNNHGVESFYKIYNKQFSLTSSFQPIIFSTYTFCLLELWL